MFVNVPHAQGCHFFCVKKFGYFGYFRRKNHTFLGDLPTNGKLGDKNLGYFRRNHDRFQFQFLMLNS